MSKGSDIAAFFRVWGALQRLVDGEPHGVDPRLVEQQFSSLGRRKHINAVKRRVAEAMAKGISPLELGAAIDGDRYLLTQESIAEEWGLRTARCAAQKKLRKEQRAIEQAAETDDEAEACRRVAAELAAVRGEAAK